MITYIECNKSKFIIDSPVAQFVETVTRAIPKEAKCSAAKISVFLKQKSTQKEILPLVVEIDDAADTKPLERLRDRISFILRNKMSTMRFDFATREETNTYLRRNT